MNSLNGFLLVDKPAGMTSHDVVKAVRKLAKTKKVGHTGTLDPNATGLLVLGIGSATKYISYLPEATKEYEAEILFGEERDTDDVTGSVTVTKDLPDVTLSEFESCLSEFIGEQEQIPPIYSAKKVNGSKLYEYARRGEEVEIKPARVRIDDIEILDASEYPKRVDIRVLCSPGTYIRSLIRDIGRELGSAATMGDLRRRKSGTFDLEDATKLDQLDKDVIERNLIPIEKALNFKTATVKRQALENLKNGHPLRDGDIVEDLSQLEIGETVNLVSDIFYGIATVEDHPKLGRIVKPKKMIDMSKLEKKEPLVLALGFFDGVHLGHQQLINRANALSKEKGIKSAVMSFENHPLTEVFPRYAPALLMSNGEKRDKILSLGTDYVFLEPFTEDLMHLSPEEFVREFLLKKYDIDTLIVGYNYTFGFKGEGRAEDLIEFGKKYGFNVEVVKPITVEEQAVSSTSIRELLGTGDVEEAERRLGHPYRITGVIREGKKLGRQYEIPTANLDYDASRLLPKNGVYFTHVIIDGKVYDGLTNLGYNPTFPEHPYAIETYIYDFDENIYGKEVTLEFLKFIRGDKKFSSVDELFDKIKSDIKETDRLYRKH